jgi:replicative DNA helicase
MDKTTTILGAYSSVGKSTWWITIIMALLYRGRKALIISNEQQIKVFKISFIVWILAKKFRYFNLTKKKMLSGDINEDDKVFIKKAQEYWNSNYKGKVKFIAIPDADMNVVKKKIRENVLKHGYDTVLYDTLKLEFSESKVNEQHFISLIKDSRELDKMAKKYNIIMLCSLQLAINTLGKLFLDSSVLSMSKQIKEVLENLFLMRTVYTEELDKSNKLYCRPFKRKKINGKWIEEEYEPDPTSTWRMLFVDKNRNGENSTDNGIAYLYKFDGSHGLFREVAMCRPKHGVIT